MTEVPDRGRLEGAIIRRFWERQSQKADDPRSTTLDTNPVAQVAREVGCYQRWMLRNLSALGCPWRRVADLACGNGDWSVVLARQAEHLFAIDLTPGFVEHCERRLASGGYGARVTLSVGDLVRCELPTELDLAVVGAVLQYIDDDEVPRVLQRVHAALAPGGLLYMRTTVARGPERIANRTSEYQAAYRPLPFFTEALARCGFTVAAAATTERVVPEETIRSLMGPAYRWIGPVITLPYRLGWRLDRARRRTDVWACVARRSVDVR